MDQYIPHKMTKGKQSHPWITPHIVRRMRDKFYLKARRANLATKVYLTKAYKKQRNKVTELIRESHETYKSEIIGPSLESNPKTFWNYIRSLKRESLGIPPQVVNNKTYSTDSSIAEPAILLRFLQRRDLISFQIRVIPLIMTFLTCMWSWKGWLNNLSSLTLVKQVDLITYQLDFFMTMQQNLGHFLIFYFNSLLTLAHFPPSGKRLWSLAYTRKVLNLPLKTTVQ